MYTQEQARNRLKEILDRIDPGMWLKVDDRVLSAAFGHDAPSDEAAEFAQRNGCLFRYKSGPAHGDGMGEFGRVYPRRPR